MKKLLCWVIGHRPGEVEVRGGVGGLALISKTCLRCGVDMLSSRDIAVAVDRLRLEGPPRRAPSVHPAEVFPALLADIHARNLVGQQVYRQELTTFNGRDALREAYEEAIDMTVYLKQALMEREAMAGIAPQPASEDLRVDQIEGDIETLSRQFNAIHVGVKGLAPASAKDGHEL